MRLLRRALGLPYKSGYYYDHPRASPERGDGTFTVDNGNVMFTPEPKDGSRRVPPAEHVLSSVKSGKVNCDSSRFPEFAGLDERPKFQGGVVHTADRLIFKETFAAEGDEGALSVSLAEDVWYLLTEELSIWAVLRLEIALEVLLIVVFALLLTVVSVAEHGARDGVLRDEFLSSLTSVRLSTDSIFGWQARSASSGYEVFVLAIQGWTHWLLLSVAGAVIVARALRPLQRVVFNPDCILADDEVNVRLQIIRPAEVDLSNVTINLQALGSATRR